MFGGSSDSRQQILPGFTGIRANRQLKFHFIGNNIVLKATVD